jgi:heme/copper-type cytochrome/quinol oxidase subunit 1
VTFARRFGILVLGAILVIAGVAIYAIAFPRPSFGWTAYAPLTSTTFVPTPFPNPIDYAMAMIVIGLVLVAGWVGFRLGARR